MATFQSLQKVTYANTRKANPLKPNPYLVHAEQFNPVVDNLSIINPSDGVLAADTVNAGQAVVTKGTVTQATSISTGVTVNAAAGTILTVAVIIATGASASAFTVTNSYVTATSVILTNCLQGATGSSIQANVSNQSAGTFDLTLTNVGGTTTVSAVVTVCFLIV
tara:strand:+ start:88 stop:582 length:495 start_codon:yes stop_codon:yes gene_type:complete